MKKTPVVFISYSWDSDDHKEWVLKVAQKLRKAYGVDIILDQFDLSAGKDMIYFMERSVVNVDKVLIIMTPEYKRKADNRERGVGYEYSMISQQFYELQTNNTKFIPILRSGELKDSSPVFMKHLIAHYMKDDSRLESDLFDLARLIYEKPAVEKPELGDFPNLDERPKEKESIIEKAKNLTNQIELKNKKQKFLSSGEAGIEANKQFKALLDYLDRKADYYKQNTGFYFSLGSSGISYQNSYGNLLGEGLCYHFFFLPSEEYIAVTLWDKPPKSHTDNNFYFPGDEPKKLNNGDFYHFDVDDNLKPMWKDKGGKLISIVELSDKYFADLMDEIVKQKSKKN
jgi:hypothetical protein